MTREDVIEEAYANGFFKVIKWGEEDYEFDFEPVRDFLNEIFDEIENRVCKNCKYCIEDSNEDSYWIECKCEKSAMFANSLTDEYGNLIDFGCNLFSLKDNK